MFQKSLPQVNWTQVFSCSDRKWLHDKDILFVNAEPIKHVQSPSCTEYEHIVSRRGRSGLNVPMTEMIKVEKLHCKLYKVHVYTHKYFRKRIVIMMPLFQQGSPFSLLKTVIKRSPE